MGLLYFSPDTDDRMTSFIPASLASAFINLCMLLKTYSNLFKGWMYGIYGKCFLCFCFCFVRKDSQTIWEHKESPKEFRRVITVKKK